MFGVWCLILIEISGLPHKVHECVAFYVNPFNAILDASVMFDNLEDIPTSEYIGNILTDSYAAIDCVSNNCGILQMASSNSGELSQYASGLIDSLPVDCVLACDADTMAHNGKIIIGLRLDGIDKFTMENSHIYNMHDIQKLVQIYVVIMRVVQVILYIFYKQNQCNLDFLEITNSQGSILDSNIHDIGSVSSLARDISIYFESILYLMHILDIPENRSDDNLVMFNYNSGNINDNTNKNMNYKIINERNNSINGKNLFEFCGYNHRPAKSPPSIVTMTDQASNITSYPFLNRHENERFALKQISKDSLINLESFEKEDRILTKLKHKNIVSLITCYIDKKNYYIATKYCHGGPLLDFILECKYFNEQQASFYLKTILNAIEYCHLKQIVHHDLKPVINSNVKVGFANDAKLMIADFGAALELKTLIAGNNKNTNKLDNNVFYEKRIGTLVFMQSQFNQYIDSDNHENTILVC